MEHKGLIKVSRQFSNNRYYVIGIEKFINTNSKPKDSDRKHRASYSSVKTN